MIRKSPSKITTAAARHSRHMMMMTIMPPLTLPSSPLLALLHLCLCLRLPLLTRFALDHRLAAIKTLNCYCKPIEILIRSSPLSVLR